MEKQQPLEPSEDARNASSILESLQPSRSLSAPYSTFTTPQKRMIVALVATASFFSPLSGNIYFPALNTLAETFSVSSAIINLTLTSYMIFQGLAPTIFGDLADMAGRRPAYIIGFVIYIGACVGIALCNSYAALLVLRCLQSTGSSGAIALASGVVADISVSAERGVWMGWALSGAMLAPAIAPVIGGLIDEYLGWRWIFWFLVILAGTFLTLLVVVFPETARNVVGDGSIPPQGWNMSVLDHMRSRRVDPDTSDLQRVTSRASVKSARKAMREKRRLRFPNPLLAVYVVLEKDVAMLLFYNSIVYSACFDVLASFPNLLTKDYGLNSLQVGLCFLPIGLGCLLAPSVGGKVMDWNFRRVASKVGYEVVKGKASDLRNFPIERVRIEVAIPQVFVGAAAILCYGWLLNYNVHLAALLVMQFVIGLFLTGAFNVMGVLLVDLYPSSPATATAANNLVRCLMGAGATAVIDYMIAALGRGWCFTFIAGVVVLLSPLLWVLKRHGPRWREDRRTRLGKDDERPAESGIAVKSEAKEIAVSAVKSAK